MRLHHKLFTTLSLLLVLVSTTKAQEYTFINSTNDYSELNSGTSITTAAPWDDPEGTIPLGFDFQFFFDTTLNTLYLDELGLGGELTSTTTYTTPVPILYVFWVDLIDRGYDFDNEEATSGSLSSISYLTEGTEGSRICKIQWKNVGFYGDIDANATSTDFVNFQLWLYEGSNVLEVHFGTSSVLDYDVSLEGENGPIIGLVSSFNYTTGEQEGDAFALTGDPASPVLAKSDDIFLSQLSGIPADGAVYKFMPAATSGSLVGTYIPSAQVFPNPTTGEVQIFTDLKNYKVTLSDLMGKEVAFYPSSATSINFSNLPAGVYIVTLSTDDEISTQRVIKQ